MELSCFDKPAGAALRSVTVLGNLLDPAVLETFSLPRGCILRVEGYTADRPVCFHVDRSHLRSPPGKASRMGVAEDYAAAFGIRDDKAAVLAIASWLEVVASATQAPIATVVDSSAVILTAIPSYGIEMTRVDGTCTVSLSLNDEGGQSYTVEVAGSLFRHLVGAAKEILVALRLCSNDDEILDMFYFDRLRHTECGGSLIDQHGMSIMDRDLLRFGSEWPHIQRQVYMRSMRPLPTCTVCLRPIKQTGWPCAASERAPGVPYVSLCRVCTGLGITEVAMWHPLRLVVDKDSGELVPRWIQEPSASPSDASVPPRFQTLWQRNSVFLRWFHIVLARAIFMRRTDRISSLPPDIIERIFSLFPVDVTSLAAALPATD